MSIEREARDKAIERIKKCLRLGQSSNAHEAAAAMRQAQKLMAQWGVSEDDLEASDQVRETVRTKEAFGGCPYLAALVGLVNHAFGVIGLWEPGSGKSRVRANIVYHGDALRVPLAVYTHRVIDRSIREAWENHRLTYPHDEQKPGARQSFRMAYLAEIYNTIEAFAMTDADRDRIGRYMQALYPGKAIQSTPMQPKGEFHAGAGNAGARAAADFRIHRPMEQQQGQLEYKS